MTKIVKVVRTEATDDVAVYLEDPTFVVTANRSDLGALAHLEWGNRPGLYVLVGGNKRYVGQASGAVVDRLKSHDKSKNWWEKIIFFGAISGGLDKAKLDYLENKLISQFTETDFFDMENATEGNTSYIDAFARVEADKLLADATNILEDIVNVDLFDAEAGKDSLIDGDDTGTHSENQDMIVQLGDKELTAKGPAAIIIAVAEFLLSDERYSDLTRSIVVNDKATWASPLGTEKNITPGGTRVTSPLKGGLHVYRNASRTNTKRIIKKLAAAAKVPVSFGW